MRRRRRRRKQRGTLINNCLLSGDTIKVPHLATMVRARLVWAKSSYVARVLVHGVKEIPRGPELTRHFFLPPGSLILVKHGNLGLAKNF